MHLLEHSADIARNADLGTNGRKQMQTIQTGVECLLLPMEQRATVQNGFTVGRAYDAYFEIDTDIKVGDRLTWSGKDLYVKAVQRYDVSMAAHLHVMCEETV